VWLLTNSDTLRAIQKQAELAPAGLNLTGTNSTAEIALLWKYPLFVKLTPSPLPRARQHFEAGTVILEIIKANRSPVPGLPATFQRLRPPSRDRPASHPNSGTGTPEASSSF
jgi:hypothetical protein